MVKLKLILYMLVVNILPFFFYDVLYIYVEDKPLEIINVHPVVNIAVFLVIYFLVQVMLFKFLLKNLYNRNLVSMYDGK